MRQFALGDLHGRYDALIQVLDASNFDYEKDELITLGDIVDGGKDTRKCVDELLKINSHIAVMGNHDIPWALNWMMTGEELPIWVHQGGLATMRSYGFKWRDVPESHRGLFENMVPFWIDSKNRLYVHGGFDPKRPIFEQTEHELTWDRQLVNYALTRDIPGYKHVFVGHTTTQFIKGDIGYTKPITFNNLTALDTGAGWYGKLTIMDVDTMEYWQSELQYPNKDIREVYTQYDDD